jgi:hypothetical protein
MSRERRLEALERALQLEWELAWKALFRPASEAIRQAVPVHLHKIVHGEVVRVLSPSNPSFDKDAVAWLETRGCKGAGWLEFFDACAPYLPQRHTAQRLPTRSPLHHPSRLPEPPPDDPRAINACLKALQADRLEDWGWALFWLWSLTVADGIRALHEVQTKT